MTAPVDPQFKASLAPRKRARTSEEKEQRRMERILRNRRAAHASREKKRRHVEYLEAYVVSLERNYSVMLSNVETLKSLLPEDKRSVVLLEADDISELKTRVYSNASCMSSSADPSTPLDVCDTPPSESPVSKRVKIEKHGTVEVPEPDSPSMNSKPSANYHSYLSPVSINSPTSSPIDLTIKQEPLSPTLSLSHSPCVPLYNSESLMFGSAISGPDYSAQNSAVILSLRENVSSQVGGARSVRV